MTLPCLGCGGLFDAFDGPVHPYMASSPACWHTYGLILAREYNDTSLFGTAHRLTVDAYALQHPGDPGDRRANQSVHLHYVSLYMIFENGAPHNMATKALSILAKTNFPKLPAAPKSFNYTAADFDLSSSENHQQSALEWANSAFEAWSELRPFAKNTLEKLAL